LKKVAGKHNPLVAGSNPAEGIQHFKREKGSRFRLPFQFSKSFENYQFMPCETTVTFFISTLAVCFSASFFIGHESPSLQRQSLPVVFSPFIFIGQLSPLQQQSSLSQHDDLSAFACLFFIGQKSFLAQQSAAAFGETLF